MICKEPYITRGSGFYWVRFLSGKGKDQKHEVQKTFLDSQYNSSSGALRDAKKFRDATAKTLGRNIINAHSRPCPHKGMVVAKRPTNTGVTGVSNNKRELESGNMSHFYTVTWMQDVDGIRKPRSKSYSYDVELADDQERAFKFAVRMRKRMVKQHYKSSKPRKVKKAV